MMNNAATAPAFRPTEAPLATKFIVLFRVLLGAMSIIGLLGWAYGTLVIVAYYGRGALFSPEVALLLFVYVYLLLSIYVCFKNPRIKTLTIAGGVLNLPLILYVVYLVWFFDEQLKLSAFYPLAFVLVWFLLWLIRWFVAKDVSRSRQILSLVLVLTSLTVGAVALKPLVTNPEKEVIRLSELGAQATNPHEAKQLFAKATDQISRIKNPYSREQPRSVIAYNQAKAGLIYDAEVTASKCTAGDGREAAFKAIVRGQVESGDWRGSVMTAKLHNVTVALFMALADHSVARAQAGQIESAKEIIRFAEQTAGDPGFEHSRQWSFRAIAQAQAKLGLHDEALSSARRTRTEDAPEQMVFIAMTEKQAGYREQSRASVQEAIREVADLPKDTVSKDTILYKLGRQLASDGMFEEARLVANSIQSSSGKDLLLRSIEYARAGHRIY